MLACGGALWWRGRGLLWNVVRVVESGEGAVFGSGWVIAEGGVVVGGEETVIVCGGAV